MRRSTEACKKEAIGKKRQKGRRLAADELNLCEFPLVLLGRHYSNDPKTLEFGDTIYDENTGQELKRELTISGADKLGLPRDLDSDVLLGLIELTQLKNNFKEAKVRFSRYELLEILGWSHSGRSYQRLHDSLNRWAGVTLYYKQSWWDNRIRAWTSRTFHVIEALELRSKDRAGGKVRSSFTWNKVVFDNFRTNHLKKLDMDVYRSLRSPIAKQAYRFLDKHFCRTPVVKFELQNFAYNHIGLTRRYDTAQLKRKLTGALEELEKIGFLKPQKLDERFREVARGKWEIMLAAGEEAGEEYEEEEDCASGCEVIELDTPRRALLEKLLERGVHRNVARQLVAEKPPEKIEEKIRLHDWMEKKGEFKRIKNPAGYLAASIRDDYQMPKELELELERSKRPAEPSAASKRIAEAEKAAKAAEAARLKAFRKFWNSLSEAEQEKLEQEAMANANKVVRDAWLRAAKDSSERLQALREQFICQYAERKGLLSIG
ncbi:MAG: hypothetical protein GXO73_10250 [Calditrichaeota bacterium]|nr:hypothetical protein [Calditrichota bacterium]